eukprot:gene5132-7148_t
MLEEKDYTLVFCRRRIANNGENNCNEILLGMKKRGFGVGKWNGFGGKIEQGETIEEAAIRELKEESALNTTDLQRKGYVVFKMIESSKIMRVHIFETWNFEGEPTESDEMIPQWFPENSLPFQQMWPDDPYWMPHLLNGNNFIGRFEYEDDETIVDHTLTLQ